MSEDKIQCQVFLTFTAFDTPMPLSDFTEFTKPKSEWKIKPHISVCQTRRHPHTKYMKVKMWKKIGFNSLNQRRDQIFLLSIWTPGTCNPVPVKIDDEEDNFIQYTFLYIRFKATVFLSYNPALLKRPKRILICKIYSVELLKWVPLK